MGALHRDDCRSADAPAGLLGDTMALVAHALADDHMDLPFEDAFVAVVLVENDEVVLLLLEDGLAVHEHLDLVERGGFEIRQGERYGLGDADA